MTCYLRARSLSRFRAVALVVFFMASAAAAAGADFTLVKPTGAQGLGKGGRHSLRLGLEPGATSMAMPTKTPWLAALEVFSINIGVWAVDRYVLKQDFARIGWSSWKKNFQQGFGFDGDGFQMNLFAHPYHGGLYFNAARSMGMSFWESTPYVLGGSLMWELFMENSRPSIDDLIFTSTCGIFVGEFLYRMSSQVLDDSATGGGRVLREFVGLVLDPPRGVNRLLSGEAWRTLSADGQIHEAMTGNLALGVTSFDEKPDLAHSHSSVTLGFDFLYGDSSREGTSLKPFDLIVFDGTIRFGKKLYFQLDSYAPLVATQLENAKGRKLVFGLFQDYDYIKNEGLELGGACLAGGLIASLPLGPKSSFRAAAQLGSMVFGGSNNIYTHLGDRDYNYGLGPVLKLDAMLTFQRLSSLSIRFAHYQIFTVGGAASEADESHDILSYLKAQANVHLIHKTGLRFDYTAFFRHSHFEGHPEFTHYYYQIQAALITGF
jgi:hypothetical protein